MIHKLKGVIDEIFSDGLSINVNGVCYFVHTPTCVIDNLKIGDNTEITIHHIFRQEQQILCGFTDVEQMKIFKTLIDVQGVGVKSAMSILSKINTSELIHSIKNQDYTLLCMADGIGKKTAQRIVMELKDKDLSYIHNDHTFGSTSNEAILALISLGYSRDDAYKHVCKATEKLGVSSDTNTIVVECLREISGQH